MNWYPVFLTLHIFAALMFVGTVFFEVLILEGIRPQVSPRFMLAVERAIGNRARKIMPWVLLGGMLLLRVFPGLMLFGIILFALTTLFSFITLPVEIDASRRALAWLKTSNLTTRETDGMARDALKSAAYTYVVAALGSLASLLYYIMIFMGRRD